MAVVISSIAPPRGRTGDQIVITGTGFGAAGNTVTVDGEPAVVDAESTAEITATVGGAPTTGQHVVIRVTNGAEYGDRYWSSLTALAALATAEIPENYPGPWEDPTVAAADYAEAKDVERLAELALALRDDALALRVLFTTRGDLVRRGASVPEALALGTTGQLVGSDGTDAAFLDGDDAAIVYEGVNYTEADATLGGHLDGIDTALGSVSAAVDVQTFSGSDTWTKPGAGTVAIIECWGGGGSGGSGDANDCGGGGGGGGFARRIRALSELGATESVTIGAGGTGKSADATPGSGGGNTTFGTHVTAYGGGGGGGGNTSHNWYGGGGAGITAVGNVGGDGTGGTAGDIMGGAGAPGYSLGGKGLFGGGGGGGGSVADAGPGPGGGAAYGGGGGGGASGVRAAPAGGTSLYAGSGGIGAYTSGAAGAGTTPSGGGGGSMAGTSGAGGDGYCRVIVI